MLPSLPVLRVRSPSRLCKTETEQVRCWRPLVRVPTDVTHHQASYQKLEYLSLKQE